MCSWRVRGLGWPACLVVLRGGYSKAGREPVVWFSPRFFFFLCGADDGNRTRVICLEGRRSTIELHPRVASTRFACGLLLLVCARGWRLCLPIDLAYECGRVVCVLSTHGVVISVT